MITIESPLAPIGDITGKPSSVNCFFKKNVISYISLRMEWALSRGYWFSKDTEICWHDILALDGFWF